MTVTLRELTSDDTGRVFARRGQTDAWFLPPPVPCVGTMEGSDDIDTRKEPAL